MATTLPKASPLPADWKPADIEEAPAVPLGTPAGAPPEEEPDEVTTIHFRAPGSSGSNGGTTPGK